MKRTMKAAVVHEFGEPLNIEEVPVPQPGPRELLVKVAACGVCHTDLHAAEGDWPVKAKLPLIPGHEMVGNIVEVGPGVDDSKVGDLVGIAWLHDACGHCEYCLSARETLCPKQHESGYSVDGGFAEYALGSANYVARFPQGADLTRIAPILCAGVTAYKAIKGSEARPGQWIAISGLGGLGHLAVQYAKAMGLSVVGIDVTDDKLALALSVGADAAVNARHADVVAQIVETTKGGAHGVVVTAPSAPAFAQALQFVRRGGTVSLVGLPPGEFQTPIFDVVLNAITIRGSIVGTREDLNEAIDFALRGRVKADVQAARLEDINQIFTDLKAGRVKGRIVLDFANAIPASSTRGPAQGV